MNDEDFDKIARDIVKDLIDKGVRFIVKKDVYAQYAQTQIKEALATAHRNGKTLMEAPVKAEQN